MSKSCFLFLMVSAVFWKSQAATIYWQGGGADDDWSTAENWKEGNKPVAGDSARIKEKNIHDANVVVTQEEQYSTLYLGYNGTNCVLTLDGGSLSASSSTVVGSASGDTIAWGKLTHLNGPTSYAQLWLGNNAGATGIYEMVSGDVNVSSFCYWGRNEGVGFMRQSGGSITANNKVYLGSSGTAYYEMSGGTLTAKDIQYFGFLDKNTFPNIEHSYGEFHQSGGTNSGTALYIAYHNKGGYELSEGCPVLKYIDTFLRERRCQ